MTRIEELFNTNFNPGYFTLIDTTHPLSIYIGSDEEGHYAIEYQGNFRPIRVKDCSAIEVKHYQKDKKKTIVFSLKDSSMLSTFCAFCEDMVESTRDADDNEKGYTLLVNRFFAWKKMFLQGAKKLSEIQIMGLIGELLFLRDFMFNHFDLSLSVSSWTGSEKTKKDFSVNNTWYEVKAIHTGKSTVKISSFEQLDSTIDGHLVVHHLEKMSPEYDGITLNRLVKQVYSMLKLDLVKDLFLQKLSDADYTFESEYDDFVYDVKIIDSYLVTVDFPCLHRTPELEAISNVEYDLLLQKIDSFKE